MVAARNQHHVVVADRHGFVQGPILGPDPLMAIALGRVQPVVIGFLQIGHAREIILVMAVRRIAGPVPGGGENLGHQERVRYIPVLHRDGVDIPGIGPFAAGDHTDGVGADLGGGVPAMAGGSANRQSAGGGGGGGPIRSVGDIDTGGRGFFEYIHPAAQFAEITASAKDFCLALDQHQNHLAVARYFGDALPGSQPIQPEPDIAPARIRDRNIMDLARCALGFTQQIHGFGSSGGGVSIGRGLKAMKNE